MLFSSEDHRSREYIYETGICPYHEVLKEVVDGRLYVTGIIHRGKVNQGIVQAVNKKDGNPDYLRTVKDNTKINNLENVPECKEIYFRDW